MEKENTFEWLNQLLTVTLNPNLTDVSELTTEQLNYIEEHIGTENNQEQLRLKNRIFALTAKADREEVVQQYYNGLLILLEEVQEYRKKLPAKRQDLKKLYASVTDGLQCLISFTENRFGNYLGIDMPFPFISLQNFQRELRQRLVILRIRFSKQKHFMVTVEVVLQVLHDFANRERKKMPVTIGDVQYKKKLLAQLEALNSITGDKEVFTELDKLLIYMNFNSKRYIDELFGRTLLYVYGAETIMDKLDRLFFCKKEFSQLHFCSGVALNPGYRHIKLVFEDWIKQEVDYLEKQKELLSCKKHVEETKGNIGAAKLLCSMSVDQMSLVLRAAEDTKILVSRSLNTVFKMLVPYLSTPNKENISWDSMRSKAYVAETKDKDRAVAILEQLIARIESY